MSAPPRLVAPVPNQPVYLVSVFLCRVASSSLYLHVPSVPAFFPDSSLVADHCLFNGSCLCLFPAGYSAPSLTACLCTDPGPLQLRTLLLPAPCWIHVLVFGLPNVYRYLTVKFVNCTYLCLRVVQLDPHTILHPLQFRAKYYNLCFI